MRANTHTVCSPHHYCTYRGTGGKILKPSITTQSKYSILRHFSYILMSCINICMYVHVQYMVVKIYTFQMKTEIQRQIVKGLNDQHSNAFQTTTSTCTCTNTIHHKLYSLICACHFTYMILKLGHFELIKILF